MQTPCKTLEPSVSFEALAGFSIIQSTINRMKPGEKEGSFAVCINKRKRRSLEASLAAAKRSASLHHYAPTQKILRKINMNQIVEVEP